MTEFIVESKTDVQMHPVLCEICGLAGVSHNDSNEFDQTVLQDGSEIFDGKVCKPCRENLLKPDCKTDVQVHPVLCEKSRLTLFVNGEPYKKLDDKIYGRQFFVPKSFSSIADLECFLKKKELAGAKKYLLRLLARRMYLTSEVKKMLQEKGVGNSISEQVISELSIYFDDEMFYASFVKKQLEKGYGPHLIRSKLKSKGVTDSEVDKALMAFNKDALDKALKKITDKLACSRPVTFKEKQKIFQKLIRRGFSSDHIQRAFETQIV